MPFIFFSLLDAALVCDSKTALVMTAIPTTIISDVVIRIKPQERAIVATIELKYYSFHSNPQDNEKEPIPAQPGLAPRLPFEN